MNAVFIKQIEEWTEKRINNILFDSDKDDWNVNTSVFDQRIMNKEHVIIIIEDLEENKFGGYVNEKIDKVVTTFNDSHSFVFSFESNGRMKGMKKFDIKVQRYAFILNSQADDYLFGFGLSDIVVGKENNKTASHCSQHSFSYDGIRNTLCGKFYFTPKRIIVIEMK
ncbi:trichohyalin, putative [Entamoeba histolytica]